MAADRASDTTADRSAHPRSWGGCPPRSGRGWTSDCFPRGSQTSHRASAALQIGTPGRRRPAGSDHRRTSSSIQGGKVTPQQEDVAQWDLLAEQARVISCSRTAHHDGSDTASTTAGAATRSLSSNVALSEAACGFYERPRSISRSPSIAASHAPSPSRARRQQRQHHRRGQSYSERLPTAAAKSQVFGSDHCPLTSFLQSPGEATGRHSAAVSMSASPLGRHHTHHGMCQAGAEGDSEWRQWE